MKASELTKVGKVFATTYGWDGKDYEGLGKMYDAWKVSEESPFHKIWEDKIFIKVYSRQFGTWVAMEIMSNYNSKAGVPVLDYFCDIEK